MPLELLKLDGAGILTPHIDLQNNLNQMPSMVPSTEGPLTVPCSLPLELILKSPHPTPHPPSSSLLLAPCVKPIVDLDLNRHKSLDMAWGPDALIVLKSQAFLEGKVSGTKWEFRRSMEYIHSY